MSVRTYYTLAVKTNGIWCPEFGDYDLEVVTDECDDSYADDSYQVISTTDNQEDIDATIAFLNGLNW